MLAFTGCTRVYRIITCAKHLIHNAYPSPGLLIKQNNQCDYYDKIDIFGIYNWIYKKKFKNGF